MLDRKPRETLQPDAATRTPEATDRSGQPIRGGRRDGGRGEPPKPIVVGFERRGDADEKATDAPDQVPLPEPDPAADGEGCTQAADCLSEHCEDGICCESGDCCQSADQCPGVGGVAAVCGDNRTCQGTRGQVQCMGFKCVTDDRAVEDDTACDEQMEADSCGPYPAVFCSGEFEQHAPKCPESCDGDAACDAAAHCTEEGACRPDLPDGERCGRDDQCESAHCQGGICCQGGDCCRAPSDCGSVFSEPPRCDEPRTCQGTRRDAECQGFRCQQGPAVSDDRGCGSGVMASGCGASADLYCNGEREQRPRCPASCDSDAQCDDRAHCETPACVPDRVDGQRCGRDSQCLSGHCQNGYCCSGGDCCASREDCPGQYTEGPTCDDVASCSGHSSAAECVDSQCRKGFRNDPAACYNRRVRDCAPYADAFCNREGQARECWEFCADGLPCDQGYRCVGERCIQPRNNGQACERAEQCHSNHCQNGHCCSGGDCCGSHDDCRAHDQGPTCDRERCQGTRAMGRCTDEKRCERRTMNAPNACAGQCDPPQGGGGNGEGPGNQGGN